MSIRSVHTYRLGASLILFLSIIGGKFTVAKAEEPLRFTPLDEESYAETLTLSTALETGAYLLVQAMLTNGGIGDEKPGCRILFVSSSGKAINQVNRDGDWSNLNERGKLSISSCALIARGDGLTWTAQTDDLSVDLSLKGAVKRVKTPRGNLTERGGFFESSVLSPFAEITAKIKAPKEGLILARGRGTLVHTRSTLLPPDVAKRWLKIYVYPSSSSSSLPLLIELKQSDRGDISGWYWEGGETSPKALTPDEVKPLEGWMRGDHATMTSIKLGGSTLHFKRGPLLFTYEPVRQYGMMGRLAKRWIGDPLNKTRRLEMGRGDGADQTPELLGFVEEIEIR